MIIKNGNTYQQTEEQQTTKHTIDLSSENEGVTAIGVEKEDAENDVAVTMIEETGPDVEIRTSFRRSVVISKLEYVREGMYDLTGFQRDLLYVISGLDNPHGLAIKDELEDYYEKEIHHGRLYPNLDTLVEKGLVEKSQRDRRTNEYTTTRRGTREIEARAEWEAEYIDHSA